MKNYYELTHDEMNEILVAVQKRCGKFGFNAFTYYVNNVISSFNNPNWIGSAISDIVFWNESISKSPMNLDIVGWYINEICYDSKYDFSKPSIELIVKDMSELLSIPSMVDEFEKRILSRFNK